MRGGIERAHGAHSRSPQSSRDTTQRSVTPRRASTTHSYSHSTSITEPEPRWQGAMRAAAAWWAALVCGVACARELDPAACAPRFDVQRDKIIRTEESRDMGARYLSELDVGARSECLRLCCETDSCDVFVFEEKGPGSCYLFNCGPPEDFRCKFTAHGNFSSGVLALSRRLAELQDQERLAHHEQELVNLRSATSSTASTRAPTAPPRTAAPPPPPPPETTRPPPPPPPPPTTAAAAAAAASGSACSRYQFACRHGGECIAVYNACDGVPQCADGSDEAPELGCPPAPRAPSPPDRVPYKPLQESVEGGEGADRWPHRLAQAQPRRYPGGENAGPHIFSHKGGLLTEPDAPQFAPFEPWPRRPWPQPALDGGESGARWEWGEADPRRAWPVPPQAPQEAGAYLPAARTMPEVPVEYSSRQQTLRDAPKKGFELRADVTPAPRPALAPAPSPASALLYNTHHDDKPVSAGKSAVSDAAPSDPKSSPRNEPRTEARSEPHAHFAPDERDEHDGLSERPPAAMMLLLIGLALTAAMGTLLGCRARAARRRLRRGKSPFAHDADYLVNGMYL